MFKKILVLLGLSSSLALTAISAPYTSNTPSTPNASSTSSPEVMETVTVTAPKPGSNSGSLVTPTQEAASATLNRIAGGTNLVDAEDYKRGRASTLKDALDFQPGVFVQSRFGSEEARLSIRGSGLQRTFHGRGIKMLQDGLTLNESDGGFDMQAFDPLAYQYIEVYRGANATRFGGITLGGAVNFVTPTGYDASLAQIRLEGGSFDTWRGQVSSGAVAGPFDYYATATHSSTDGFRQYSQQNNQRVLTNFGWRPYDTVETRLYFNYAQSDSELPGSLTKAQLESSPTQAAAANVTRRDKRDFTTYRLASKTTVKLDESLLEAGLYWTHKDLDHPIFNVLTRTFATGPGVIDLNSNNYGADLRFTSNHEVFGRQNRFTVGINPSGSIAADNRFENLNNTSSRGRKFAQGTESVFNLEAYVENEHYLTERFAVIPGLVAVHTERRFVDDLLADGDSSLGQDYLGFMPKLGLRYDFNEKTNAFFNVSRSFEPPSFGEIKAFRASAGPPVQPNRLPILITQKLDAQEATTIEIGSRGEWNRLAWDIAFYHAWVDNELLSLNDAQGNPLGTINSTATHHQGVEAGFTFRLLDRIFQRGESLDNSDRIQLRTVYNWSNFYFDSDPVYGSNNLAGIPEHYLRTELMYEHPNGFYFGPNLEWSAVKSPIDHQNTFFADPYLLINLKAGYRSARGFSVFIEGRNLTDKMYSSTTGVVANANGVDSAQFSPGDGASVFGGVEWRY